MSTAQQQAEALAAGLYAHQVEGIAFLLGRQRAILADDMGLGKTRQSVLAMRQARPEGPYLVVCPAAVKINWAREIELVLPTAEIAIVAPHPRPHPAIPAGSSSTTTFSPNTRWQSTPGAA